VLAGLAGLHGMSPVTELAWPAYGLLIAAAVIAWWMPNTNELFLAADNGEARAPAAFHWFGPTGPQSSLGVAIGLLLALCLLSIDKADDFIYAQF